jgi:penicillin-binding protein 2
MKRVHLTGMSHTVLPGTDRVWRRSLLQAGESGQSRIRLWPFLILLVSLGFLLSGRLFVLTVVEGSYHRDLADSNRVVAIRTAAPRGIIYDQNEEVLTINRPAYKHQVPGTAIHQAQFVAVTKEEAVQLSSVSGERVFYDISREYGCGRACAPLLGYMGEVNLDELEQMKSTYMMGDTIGKSGIEKAFENDLRGKPGYEMIEVDSQGKQVRVVGKEDYQAGTDLHLTVDRRLQEKIYTLFEGRPGAAVVQVPQTGEILALVTSPAYDPNNVGLSLEEKGSPFFNRAVAGAYPPGSVFKMVSIMAGIESEKIDSKTAYEDTGVITIDDYSFGTWNFLKSGKTEGLIDAEKALQRSNDIYFYRLGETLGPKLMGEWASILGFGSISTLSFLGEVPGLIPSPEWKEKTLGERWFLGNTYHMAIGQGDVMVTPLQVNRMMGAISVSGVLCDPILLKHQVGKQSCRQLNLKPETVTALQQGLIKACEPGGTGVPFFRFLPKVACKTGTAQQGGDEDQPHSWFTVYAPAQAPEIVMTVLMEKAGEGSEVAAPLAYEVLNYWFNGKE